MDLKLWETLRLMAILMKAIAAVRLYPCDSGYRDVKENSAVTFHCDQYNGYVNWRYKGSRSATFTPISTCNATQCTRSLDADWTPTFISAGNNSLTSTLTSRNVELIDGQYWCGSQMCKVHIIAPASVKTPTSSITRSDQGYSLHCQTNITKVYSSKGQYFCVWQNGMTQVAGTLNLTPPPHDTNNTSNRMGTCNATLRLSNPSDAICNVTVSPGNTNVSSEIVLPSEPEIRCPPCPVQENSNITCTCITDNLGQPGGRLVWYAGTNGVFDREIVRGSFDVKNLTMTRTLNRSDHNITMFRCVNEWITNVNASTDFNATVNWNDNSTSTRRRRKRNAVSTSSPCFDSTNAETPEDSPTTVIIIVGIIGGGAGSTGVVVIVVLVIKRRKKGAQKAACNHHQGGNRTASDEDPDYDIEIVNVCYESSESTFGQVPGSHYEYIDTRLSMNPTLQVAAYAQSSKYTAKENITDEYACVRRDR